MAEASPGLPAFAEVAPEPSDGGAARDDPWPFPAGPLVGSLAAFDEQPLTADRLARVATARVAFANHRLLQHDFPHLRNAALAEAHPWLRRLGADERRREIAGLLDAWLLRHAGFMSESQLGQVLVNTQIRTTGERVEALRPPWYGRAALLPLPEADGAAGAAFLDLKGVGVEPGVAPRRKMHCDGLLPLWQALQEVLFEGLIGAVLREAGTLYDVVPSYGVLDLGFDVKFEGTLRMPAGVLVRRAHTRPAILWGKEDPGPEVARVCLDILLLLRRHGIDCRTRFTLDEVDGALRVVWFGKQIPLPPDELEQVRVRTGFQGRRLKVECANVQFTSGMRDRPRRPQLFDFNAFQIYDTFSYPLYCSSTADVSRLAGEFVTPGDPRFTRPTRETRFPVEANWIAQLLVRRYRAGELTGDEVRQALADLIARARPALRCALANPWKPMVQ